MKLGVGVGRDGWCGKCDELRFGALGGSVVDSSRRWVHPRPRQTTFGRTLYSCVTERSAQHVALASSSSIVRPPLLALPTFATFPRRTVRVRLPLSWSAMWCGTSNHWALSQRGSRPRVVDWSTRMAGAPPSRPTISMLACNASMWSSTPRWPTTRSRPCVNGTSAFSAARTGFRSAPASADLGAGFGSDRHRCTEAQVNSGPSGCRPRREFVPLALVH